MKNFVERIFLFIVIILFSYFKFFANLKHLYLRFIDGEPIANFSYSKDTVCAGDSIIFTDLSINNPNYWEWHFEGGTPSISYEQNPIVYYYTPGKYSVTLIVSNDYGADTLLLDSIITIMPIQTPTITIYESENYVCYGTPITFYAITSYEGNNPTYLWLINNDTIFSTINNLTIDTLNNLDSIKCILISSEQCLDTNLAISNKIIMNIIPTKNLNVTIYTNEIQFCSNDTIIIYSQLSDENINNLTYYWYLNHQLIDSSNSTLNLINVNNNDTIYCIVFSNDSCVNNNPDTSNYLILNILEAPIYDLIINNVTCYGLNNGSAYIFCNDTSLYSFYWSTGDTNTFINNLSPGNYSVTVINKENNCSSNSDFIITQPNEIQIEYSITYPLCNQNNGSIEIINIISDFPIDSILWLPDSLTNTFIYDSLYPGNYYIHIIDANNCTFVDSFVLYSTNISYNIDSLKDVSCFGGNDGYISISATNGTEPFSYIWNTNDTTSYINNLTAGIYTFTITDANGCSTSDSIFIIQPNQIIYNLTVIPSFCGSNNGEIIVHLEGGIPPYSLVWDSDPQPDDPYHLSNLSSGYFNFTVTDFNNCTLTEQIFVPDSSYNQIISSVVNNSCNICNGKIILNPIDPSIEPLQAIWNTGDTTLVINNLCANEYTVTITDINNCQSVYSFNIIDTNIFSIDKIIENISCHNQCDGKILLIPTGGQPPYIFNGVDTTGELNNLCSGTYYFTVSDAFNCIYIDSAFIIEPEPLEANLSFSHATCNQNNGEVIINAVGGTPPYSFSLYPPLPLNELSPGTYQLTISDTNNCTIIYDFSIYNLGNIQVLIDSIKHISCYGFNDGYINLDVNTDTTYQIEWSNNVINLLENSNLTAGTYYFTITNDYNCILIDSITIYQPNELTITSNINNADCGHNNGSVNIFVEGGTPPYSYIWDTEPPANTDYLTNLSPGDYTVTVFDSNNCSISLTSIVSFNNNIQIIVDSIKNVTCFGYSDGFIAIHVNNAYHPVYYSWSNGANDSILSNLPEGLYEVTITDAMGCFTIQTFTINSPQLLNVYHTLFYHTCNYNSPVTINLNVSGGNPPYTYLWSNGNTTQNITVNQAGIYTVTVIDSKNCPPAIDTIIVNQYPNFQVQMVKNDIKCFGECTGSIDLTISGGMPPYNVFWSGPNNFTSTEEDLINLCAGFYKVTIVDSRGCSTTRSIGILERPKLSVYLNPNSATCYGLCDGKIYTNVSGGTSPYYYYWEGPSCNPCNSAYLANLCAGTYYLTVTDYYNCSVETQTIITQPDGFHLESIVKNVSCYGYNDGSITLIIDSTITEPFTIAWVGPANFTSSSQNITNLIAGTYTAIVTTQSGHCSSLSANVGQPPKIQASFEIKNETYPGSSDGIIIVHLTGGTPPYSLQWSNGMSNDTITGLSSNYYTLTITDNNGCQLIKTVFLGVGIGIKDIPAFNNCFSLYQLSDYILININQLCEIKNIELINLLGKTLVSLKPNSSNTLIINKNLYAKGIYYIKISNNNNSFYYKILIN